MRIAVFGAGGVGGYFGGLLANAGHDVTFIARGKHLAAIKKRGLQVESVYGDFRIRPAIATDDPGQVGPVDYVVVGVKHYHLRDAAKAIQALVNPGTTVIPLLNGVDAHEHLIRELGQEPVVGGLCSLVSMIKAPGVIFQPSRLRRIVVGELSGEKSERVARIVQSWEECGAEAIHADDIVSEMWKKLIFIASIGGATSLSQATIGEIVRSPEARQLFIEAMQEVEAVGRALGVDLPADIVPSTLQFAEGFEPGATTSMQRDVAAGRRFELDAFSGSVVRLGREAGIPTPVHRAMDALLRPALTRS